MPNTPETLRSEPQIQEINKEAEFPNGELIQKAGGQVVQKTFKAQVTDDKGAPVIQTPPTQVITVTPPSDTTTLTKQAKGNTTSSSTWLATFWLRIIKKAIHFGWKIIGKEQNAA